MPRRSLGQAVGLVFHVMNRGVRRFRLFDTSADYKAFLRVLAAGRERTGIQIYSYCVMPNHFHLVLRQNDAGQLPDFMNWFQGTHSKRWHRHRQSAGTGAVYQGRYKACPVQEDGHFLTVCRYVERNPARAGLVRRAQEWPWSSLREHCGKRTLVPSDPWPIPRPEAWLGLVNVSQSASDLAGIRKALAHGGSFGSDDWVESTNGTLGISGRSRGRPVQAAG